MWPFNFLKHFKKVEAGPVNGQSSSTAVTSKYFGCDIEFLPHAGKYYPRVNGKYLFWWTSRENYSLEQNISGCCYSSSKEGAINIIDNYFELRGVGSEIIKIDL